MHAAQRGWAELLAQLFRWCWERCGQRSIECFYRLLTNEPFIWILASEKRCLDSSHQIFGFARLESLRLPVDLPST